MREGFTIERTELAIAQLTSFQINKATKKGSKKVKAKDLLAYGKPWDELEFEIDPDGYDMQTFRSELAGPGTRIIRVDRVTRKPI